MSFAQPWFLLGLIVPLLAMIGQWRRHGHQVALPFDHSRLRSGSVMRFFLNGIASIPALLLATVILILAGPQQIAEPKTKRSLTNIQFCLDVSGSMTANFGDGTQYDAAVKSLNEFISWREGDAFGLTFFGSEVMHWVPLTSDTAAFKSAPEFLSPEKLPSWFPGGTMIGKALRACRDALSQREEGDRMILLLSDGSSADLYGGADEEVGRMLAKDQVTVYAIHIGTGIPQEVNTITSLTGGEVFEAGDPQALHAVFERIDEMAKAKLEKVSAETMDYFFPFGVVGLSLLGVYVVSLLGFRYTPW